MKTLKYILMGMLVTVFAAACNEGIDPISHVAPGPDELAPEIKVTYPTNGLEIVDRADIVPLSIQATIADDIELGSVSVSMNGKDLTQYSEFKDYRRLEMKYQYPNLEDGSYVLTIKATDLTGKSTTKTVNFSKTSRYQPKYNGEIFYMPFDDNYQELISEAFATKVGFPTFTEGKTGLAYKGAENGYLTFPLKDASKNINLGNTQFSAAFWYKLNATPDRAGVLVVSPKDSPPAGEDNNLLSGFRFFREAGNGGQTFKLNVGDGTGSSWFDGGAAATTTSSGWIHLAFTISGTECVVYLNGAVASKSSFSGISWNACESVSIMSGAPYFTGWSHNSDESFMDELRIFDKALTVEEIQAIMNDQK